ncbi:GNAT family N-acetyltransferase [Rosenbergiella australiborealis]|uniref:GNAT family N-acetyltransferase n=1 Tax=Rosenbergiella australiborealis TaxID=1544696 RepID=A0ABS5T6Q3_9GAMM|nr:GNAT family N-acetyltransferase [Rosenbergiella australiborealis]MBT0727185.1 GNAT family N-acetyltransferase [Rosenbergiella australiborealis]
MDITCCKPDEWADLVEIFSEMERYHHPQAIIAAEQMAKYLRERVFPADSGTEIYKGMREGHIVAFACVTVVYPASRFTGQMFIKELFVSKMYRRQGLGRQLMHFIAQRAEARGCTHLDWLSVREDRAVQDFYTSLGARVVEEVNYHRLDQRLLSQLAASSDRI